MKKVLVFPVFMLLMVCIPAAKTYCQAGIPADSIKNMLVRDWERSKIYTQEYMTAMPAAAYSFKATDSIRSFAQQLLHITEATMFFISTATGEKLPGGRGLEARSSAQSADSVMYYVNNAYDYAIRSIKNMPAANFMQNVSVNIGQTITATRLGWLLKGFEHQAHHRGQTTVYLRLKGVRPPNERSF